MSSRLAAWGKGPLLSSVWFLWGGRKNRRLKAIASSRHGAFLGHTPLRFRSAVAALDVCVSERGAPCSDTECVDTHVEASIVSKPVEAAAWSGAVVDERSGCFQTAVIRGIAASSCYRVAGAAQHQGPGGAGEGLHRDVHGNVNPQHIHAGANPEERGPWLPGGARCSGAAATPQREPSDPGCPPAR